jgi:hypothetical protein
MEDLVQKDETNRAEGIENILRVNRITQFLK